MMASLFLFGCLQLIVYRHLYLSSYRAAVIGIRRTRTSAWTSAAVSMTMMFSTWKLVGGTSREFDAAVSKLGEMALKLAEVDARYRRRTDKCRRRSSVASSILCVSVWIPAIAMAWSIDRLDGATDVSMMVSLLLLTTTGAMMVGVPSLAEERAERDRCRKPPFLDEWSSSLVAIRDHRPEGLCDPNAWEILIPGCTMVYGPSVLSLIDGAFCRMVIETLLRAAIQTADVPGPERVADSAPSGTGSADGGASE